MRFDRYGCAVVLCGSFALNAAGGGPVSFRRDIAPILFEQCQTCHGPKKAKGDFRLDSYARLRETERNAIPAITPGDPGRSEIYNRVSTDDEDDRMPYKAEPLNRDRIELIKRWIAEGARFDGEDREAPLNTLIPPRHYPAAPEVYPRAIPIAALAFSRGGKELVAGGYHELTVWDPATGELVRRISNHCQRTYGLSVSADGEWVAAAGGEPGRSGEVRIFRADTGELIKVLSRSSDVVLGVAFSLDGAKLASCGSDATVRVYSTATWRLVRRWSTHSDWVYSIAWNPTSDKVVSASRDGTAKVFDLNTGRRLMSYSGHAGPVRRAFFYPADDAIVSFGSGGAVQEWRFGDGKKTRDIAKLPRGGLSGTMRDHRLWVTTDGGEVIQVALGGGEAPRAVVKHHDWVVALAYDEPSHRLAAGTIDGFVMVWGGERDGVFTFPAWPRARAASSR